MKKSAGRGFVIARDAIVAPVHIVSAEDIQRLIIINKARDKEIQLAVVVVVKPDCAGGPAGRRRAGLISDVGERRIPIVVVKNISSITCNVEIDVAITVIVSRGGSHTESAPTHTSFFSDVGERPVMIITV